MAKETITIHGKEYKPVAMRVNEFRADHKDWGIRTELVENDDRVIIKASVVTSDDFVIGTGYAEETRNSSQINRTSALENCETSAIGRALAACGYGGTEYASANEVQNAIQQAVPIVKIDPKQKKEFISQVIAALEAGDDQHLKELWAEWNTDEKAVLWSSFNSQQRASMKEMMK